jgi:hypothetical protein
MTLSVEQIEQNWKQYLSYLEKLGSRAESALHIANTLEDRLVICPASSKRDHHNAFPGGLVDHSLRVLTNAIKIIKAFKYELPLESVVLVALFHDLGKVGDHEKDYYLKQNDDWRNNKLGEEYTFNKELTFMTVPDRSLFLCQHYGLKLQYDEFIAIKIHDGLYADENVAYKFKEPLLADVIHIADLTAAKQEKQLFAQNVT